MHQELDTILRSKAFKRRIQVGELRLNYNITALQFKILKTTSYNVCQ